MAQELNEGEVIQPRRVEKDALLWKILKIQGDEVTFQSGNAVFKCHKSGLIYKLWEKEYNRRANGGAVEEPLPGIVIAVRESGGEPVFEPIGKAVAVTHYAPMVRLVDSQLEERQYRMGDLRKKAALLDWCNHEKDICTGKCKLLDDIRAIKKKILGDP
jgi:hypothetical protein